MDLSLNTGGEELAGAFVLAWFLGEAQVSVSDPVRGAESTMLYRADVNLDRKFDESDTISGLDLFCLISPMSFSCGNLVPCAFKSDGREKRRASGTRTGARTEENTRRQL